MPTRSRKSSRAIKAAPENRESQWDHAIREVEEKKASFQETHKDFIMQSVNAPKRRQRPTMFEKQAGITEQQIRENQEMRQVSAMVDQFHKIKMDKLIQREIEDKKLNDRIMKFAEVKSRTSYVTDKRGITTGSVKATAKSGN